MFGNNGLLDAAALRKYAAGLEAGSDDELVDETRSQVYDAGFHQRHSAHDQRATKCLEESERRGKPWLYQRGYNRAMKEAGSTPDAFAMERAPEEHYRKEDRCQPYSKA